MPDTILSATEYKRLALVTAAWAIGFQLLIILLTSISTPTYMMPFFYIQSVHLFWIDSNYWEGLSWFDLWLWELIGVALMYSLPVRSSVVSGWVVAVFWLAFALPATIYPYIGPSTLAPRHNLGPAIHSSVHVDITRQPGTNP